jgi:hypothetical protein
VTAASPATAFPSAAFSDITARYRNNADVALHLRNSADLVFKAIRAAA